MTTGRARRGGRVLAALLALAAAGLGEEPATRGARIAAALGCQVKAAGDEAISLEFDFERPAQPGWIPQTGTWSFERGRLVGKKTGRELAYCQLECELVGDVSLRFKATPRGAMQGVQCFVHLLASEGTSYEVGAGEQGNRKIEGQGPGLSFSRAGALVAGREHTIELAVADGVVTYRLDGQLVFEGRMQQPLTRGRLGVGTQGEVEVDDVTVIGTPTARWLRTRGPELDWKWTFADDLTRGQLEAKREVARRWQRALWEASERTFLLRRLELEDRSQDRWMLHTPAGRADASMLIEDAVWAKVEEGTLWAPGNCNPVTWVHEAGHLLFGCPDEDDDRERLCGCIMAATDRAELRWCDAANHRLKDRPPCWEGYLLKRYPDLKRPGEERPLPELELVIRDR